MKTGIIASILAAFLGLSSVADACHRGARHGKGVTGTVTSIGKSSLTLSVASSNGRHSYIVKITAGTTIAGTNGHTIDSTLVGHPATVVGAAKGGTIRASEIVIVG